MDVRCVTKQDIIAGLKGAGLAAGDTVMVHSSLKAFGRVENGADDVIDALLDVVGKSGTVVMPTFTFSSYRCGSLNLFCVDDTPSETGIITEKFRKRPSVLRSSHITHSVAACGPKAKMILGQGISPWGEGSSFEQLEKTNAWNLLLGVGFEACTALHRAEELVQVPYRQYRSCKDIAVIYPDGKEEQSQSLTYFAQPNTQNDFQKMLNVFQYEGILNIAKVGQATIINSRIKDIVASAVNHLNDDMNYLLKN